MKHQKSNKKKLIPFIVLSSIILVTGVVLASVLPTTCKKVDKIDKKWDYSWTSEDIADYQFTKDDEFSCATDEDRDYRTDPYTNESNDQDMLNDFFTTCCDPNDFFITNIIYKYQIYVKTAQRLIEDSDYIIEKCDFNCTLDLSWSDDLTIDNFYFVLFLSVKTKNKTNDETRYFDIDACYKLLSKKKLIIDELYLLGSIVNCNFVSNDQNIKVKEYINNNGLIINNIDQYTNAFKMGLPGYIVRSYFPNITFVEQ